MSRGYEIFIEHTAEVCILHCAVNLHSVAVSTTDKRGTQWRSWLRHYDISRKVATSIPDGVIGNVSLT
jgi:hypothetical protein